MPNNPVLDDNGASVYTGPNIIDVGTVVSLTGKFGSPLVDSALHDGSGYFKPQDDDEAAEVEPESGEESAEPDTAEP